MMEISNPQGSNGFTGYTEPAGDCKNPAYIAQFFEDMGQALKDAICSGRTEDRLFVLQKFSEMQGVVDTLVGQEGFAEDLASLQALINDLRDQDGDGINDLEQVKARLDTLETNYNALQPQISSMAAAQTQHGQQITNLQTSQTQHGQQITDLQNQINNLDADTLGIDLDASRCETVSDIYNAMEAGFQAFMEKLVVTCELPTVLPADEGSGELGEDDVPDSL